MRHLLTYMKPYRKLAFLAPLFKLLEATLELFVPIVMTAIIDRGIARGDDGFILWMGAVLLGLAAVGMTVSITAQYFAARAAIGFTTDVKHALFTHITHLSAASVDRVGAATLTTRLTSDMNQVSTGINLFLRLFLRSPFIVFGAMVMAFTIDVRAALVFAVVIPVLGLIVWLCLKFTIPMVHDVQKQMDTVLRRTSENLSGARVIRAFVRQEEEKRAFEKATGELYSRQMGVGRLTALMNPVTLLVVNLGMLVLIAVGGVRVEVGGLTQGQVVALVNYMSQILVELVKLANLILNINRALACAGRVQEVFELPEETSPSQSEEMPLQKNATADIPTSDTGKRTLEKGPSIVCKDLSFRYPGAQGDALHNVSFTVKSGETWGILGGTGAGKSTLLKLLLGYYDGTEGTLSVDGCAESELASLRENTGYVPQKSVLFAGTVRENLRMGDRDASDEVLWQALEAAQAADFVRDKEGLDTPVEEGGRNFSGGQRQRLCIARALVRRPRLLILDDSFSALDAATESALRKGVTTYLSDIGTTLLIVSQRIASVRQADGILVLEEGGPAGVGTHEELMDSCEVYREIARIGGGA